MNGKLPPSTPRREVREIFHGETIIDPYRWLEEDGDSEVQSWIEEQNAYTQSVLLSLPHRESMRTSLERALEASVVGTGAVRGHQAFFTKRPRGMNQPVLQVAPLKDPAGAQTLVDPNPHDPDGLASLDWWVPSPQGNMVAYGLSWHGDEWSTLKIVETATGRVLEDEIPRARFASIAWDPDETGFYYTRFPLPGEMSPGDEFYYRRVFHHLLGRDFREDPLVFGEERPKRETYEIAYSSDSRHLLLTVREGWNRADIYLKAAESHEFRPLISGKDALFSAQMVGNIVYALTNHQAGRYRIIAIDPEDPSEDSWQEIVPEQPEMVLREMRVMGDKVVVIGQVDAVSRLAVFDFQGNCTWESVPRVPSTMSALEGEERGRVAIMREESFIQPPRLSLVDLEDNKTTPWMESEEVLDPESVSVQQVFFPSRDGTSIPMFIVKPRGAAAGEPRPLLLTGYGGFNQSRSPSYIPDKFAWLEKGGVFALANLRGGSEYGEDWHRAGMLENKQKVFDDFIGAAQYLVQKGYTDRDRLAIYGRSNGGLLVGAAMTQRPDLFRAVGCGVPLLDMLRYHRFLIAEMWIPEYGSADDPRAFRWLRDYSPYHQVKEGVQYPATIFFCASSDTRVHPLHARKMTALLREETGSDPLEKPILFREEAESGHGAGKPVGRLVEEHADVLSFLAWQVGLT